MQCRECHKDIDETRFKGLAFCPYCGASTAKQKKALRLAFCPFCGKELKEAAPFCPQCGKKLPDNYSSEEGETVAPGQHHDILAESKEFLDHTAGAIRRNIGKERKVRKLYEQWAEHSDLPEEELANIETEIHHQAPKSRYLYEEEANYETFSKRRQQMPILYILLALAVLIIVAGVILLLTR